MLSGRLPSWSFASLQVFSPFSLVFSGVWVFFTVKPSSALPVMTGAS